MLQSQARTFWLKKEKLQNLTMLEDSQKMQPTTLQIRSPAASYQLIMAVLAPWRPYRKGTDPEWYVDFLDRPTADLYKVNMEQLPGVKVELFRKAPKSFGTSQEALTHP